MTLFISLKKLKGEMGSMKRQIRLGVVGRTSSFTESNRVE